MPSYFPNQFLLLVGNTCHHGWPGGLLPPPPPLPPCDWQLSISVNHQFSPLSPALRACARWALNWCLVQRYQMARQMTSPWPHYTRTQRRGSVPTEQRADPTRTTSQHANACGDEESPQNSGIHLHPVPPDEWVISRKVNEYSFFSIFSCPTPILIVLICHNSAESELIAIIPRR